MNFQFRLTLALIFSSMIFNLGILPANAQGPQFLPGRISIVWPQDGFGHGVGIAQARALNLSIWPIGRVSCVPSQNVSLLIAKNNEPALVWGKLGQVNLRTGQFGKFPTIDFNDIPADMVSEPAARYHFILYAPVSASINEFSGNIWVHAADPRTIQPNPIVPTGFSTQMLPAQGLDTRIQIVWPHDLQGNLASVTNATRLNITVEVFEHGTLKAILPDASGKFRYTLALYVADGNDVVHPASYSTLTSRTYVVDGQTYTQWIFNDVPVIPGHQYHFLAGATAAGRQDVYPYSTIWTHAQEGRTLLPNPQDSPACVP